MKIYFKEIVGLIFVLGIFGSLIMKLDNVYQLLCSI